MAKTHKPMPVAGYTEQDEERIAIVNGNKLMEERFLQMLDAMGESPDIDQRWLAVGRTHIEQGFMAINRAVFRPERLQLDE